MSHFLQLLANGLMAGAIYGLVAVALALVFGVLEIPQFAFGAHAMVAAYALLVFSSAGVPYVMSFLGALLVGLALGFIVQWVVFDPLYGKPPATLFLVAFGLLMILQGSAAVLFGPNPRPVEPLVAGVVQMFGVYLTYQRLVIIAGTLVAIVVLNLFLRQTRLGLGIRAAGQNPLGALAVGINPRRISAMTMSVGSTLAAVAGCLLAPLSQVYPTMGDSLIIKAFIIVIMAGMGTVNGALAAGMLMGVIESFGGAVFSSSLRDVYSILLLVLVLLLKPSGMFGNVSRRG